ncbi:MAG: RNA-guided endonuclease TnpB family protein [Chlamydiae bacterium]|nr:RNA-guided endonuclease TnpB family protein [Chlamydiota bacterium]
MSTSAEIEQLLEETSRSFADACNYILHAAIEAKTNNAIKLHQLCYSKIREKFNLSANLSIRALRRVAGNLTRLKKPRRRPREYKPRSIDYDARIFYYKEKEQSVSLRTKEKRIKVFLELGEYQKKLLTDQIPTAATVIKKSNHWYIHMVIEYKVPLTNGNQTMGIDLGIVNIAVASMGMKAEGKLRREYKDKQAAIKASLQSKGTHGAKRVLKRKSGKEKRRIRHENHVLSKRLAEEAKRHHCGLIRMEQLKDIRDKTKTWSKHWNRMVAGWSFYQLQQFITYKAAEAGIAIELVNPAYTSQTCHQCLQLGSREKERFKCLTCGEMDADINAAIVISKGGAVCKPARISSVS